MQTSSPQIRDTDKCGLSVDKFERSTFQRGPGLIKPSRSCEFYLQEPYLVLTVKIGEKVSHVFSISKVAIFKYAWSFLIFVVGGGFCFCFCLV